MIHTHSMKNSVVTALSILALLMLLSHSISNQDFSLFKLCIAAIAGLGLHQTWQQYSRQPQRRRPTRTGKHPSYRWHCRDCDEVNAAASSLCRHCGLNRDQHHNKGLITRAEKPLASH